MEVTGVLIGGGSARNTISDCSISGNTLEGIALSASNGGITPPRITFISGGVVQGEVDSLVPDGTLVEIFADSEDEGLK